MRLIKIEDTNEIKPFNCGDDDLNGFLLEDARYYQEQLIANTFIMEDEEATIAFFSLLNDKISQTTIDKNLWRKLRKSFPYRKHLGSYPAVKIGRLGVATSHRGEGIGTDIVSAVKQMLINRQSVSATRFLSVDAYLSAVPFYEKNGFRPLLNTPCEDTLPMYFDLMQLVK